MKNLPNLFKLIELTRAQVQQGYLLSGIPREKISNLAEHHYLVTFIAWQLAINLKEAGAKLDVQKVMELCLVHDLGELMGGDISAFYAQMNPKARKHAKMFEAENQKYLAKFFGNNTAHFKKLASEVMDAKSDEGVIFKIADYMEALSFKVYVGHFVEADRKFNIGKMAQFTKKIKDKTTKKLMQEFLALWIKDVNKNNYIEILKGS